LYKTCKNKQNIKKAHDRPYLMITANESTIFNWKQQKWIGAYRQGANERSAEEVKYVNNQHFKCINWEQAMVST
jgi:hypothetical protein